MLAAAAIGAGLPHTISGTTPPISNTLYAVKANRKMCFITDSPRSSE
jgi:hypothetical protein